MYILTSGEEAYCCKNHPKSISYVLVRNYVTVFLHTIIIIIIIINVGMDYKL
jgi:hypothetical protein